MKQKNLRTTEGLPFTLGVVAGVFLLLGTILTIYTTGMLRVQSGESFFNIVMIGMGVGLLVNPGLFLLVLTSDTLIMKKHGKKFVIAWMILSGLGILNNFSRLLTMGNDLAKLTAVVDSVLPDGLWIEIALSTVGSALMIVSCIVLLKRLNQPPEPVNPEAEPFGDA